MPPKKKGEKGEKSPPWFKCEVCGVAILSHNYGDHEHRTDCPITVLNVDKVKGGRILNGVIYAELEIVDAGEIEEAKTLSPEVAEDLIFVSSKALESSDLVIGDRVVVSNGDTRIVRRVWPLYNPPASSIAFLNHQCSDPGWHGTTKMRISIAALQYVPNVARVITVLCPDDDSCDREEFKDCLRISQIGRVRSPSNTIKLQFFAKNLKIKIANIESSLASTNVESADGWFSIAADTKWIIKRQSVVDEADPAPVVGGVDHILENIGDMMKNAFNAKVKFSNINFAKTVLLYGPSGVGKTLICKHFIASSGVNVVEIDGSEVFSKFYGETERTLKKKFDEAARNSPSLIIIDDVHVLCGKKSSTTTDQERRILSTMETLLDNVHNSREKIFILAATSKLDSLDPTLRRYGRIDCEIEIPVPAKDDRLDIMKKLFSTFPHELSEEHIKTLAESAHGYVGADIVNLTTQAVMHAMKTRADDSDIKILSADMEWAFKQVKPSAMREIFIDVPNVKWNDIGGQKDLKLKLKQSIEWPLKHAESFTRFGIKPPSGLLMYGPPGCSKTMIAKALASESGLNFLSIKGPELFSKWVGESERAVREVFRKARQVAPSIVFFDEIDALGGERSKHGGNSNVQERVLAQILTELDGVSPLGNVMIVAATNRPDKIDSALLRPGRLDRIVYVPLPDEETRLSIFNIKLAKMPIADNISVQQLVEKTEGYSGAEIQAVCHEAALKALEEDINSVKVLPEHFEAALQQIQPRTPSNLLSVYEEFRKSSLK